MPVRNVDFTAASRHAGEFRVSLSLSVADVEALWDAAAARAMASIPDATAEDVEDVIGPREAPEIADCLAMLAGPSAIPGCTLTGYRVEERNNTVAEHPKRAPRPVS